MKKKTKSVRRGRSSGGAGGRRRGGRRGRLGVETRLFQRRRRRAGLHRRFALAVRRRFGRARSRRQQLGRRGRARILLAVKEEVSLSGKNRLSKKNSIENTSHCVKKL